MKDSIYKLFLRASATAALASALVSVPAVGEVIFYDIPSCDIDTVAQAQVLQGLVNRSGPRLQLRGSCTYWDANNPYWQDANWNTYWQNAYQARNGTVFRQISGQTNLIQYFKTNLTGLVVYDPAISGSRVVAINLAGLYNLLPVTNAAAYAWLGLPTTYNLVGQFANSVAAYAWATNNVLPLCNRGFGNSDNNNYVDGKYIGWGDPKYDYMAMNRGFTWSLTALYTDVTSWGRTINGDTAQADMFRAILGQLNHAYIVGYSENEENFFALTGQYGHRTLGWGDNYSFHAAMPAKMGTLRQGRHYNTTNVTVAADKYYVCFLTSEGDTMKMTETFFNGSWKSPARGSVPMNLACTTGFNRFPGMADYYYSTATSNDYFIGFQVNALTMSDPAGYAMSTKNDLVAADMPVCNAGLMSNAPVAKAVYDTIRPLGALEMSCWYTVPRGGYLEFYSNGVPVVCAGANMIYWARLFANPVGSWNNVPDLKVMYQTNRALMMTTLTNEINYIASQHQPPFIITLMPDTHGMTNLFEFHADIASNLGPQYKVARLDEAFAAIRKWKQTAPVSDGFELGFDNWDTQWDRATDQKHTGSYSARANPDDTYMAFNGGNTAGAKTMTISFWYRDAGIDDNDNVFFQLWNGSAWVNWFELGNSTENQWNFYSTTLTNAGGDTVFFRSDFKLSFDASGLDWGFLGFGDEYLWIDDVRVTLQPHQAATATTLTSSANPAFVGSNVTFTATVRTNGVIAASAAGSMIFKDGDATLASQPVFSGVAAFTTANLALGSHDITAEYSGDTNFLASMAYPPLTQIITNVPTRFTLTVPIASSSDDAEEDFSGNVNLTSSDLELVNDDATGAGDQTIGVRFTGLAIPSGAYIRSATIQFTTDETQTNATALTIRAQAADSAPTFAAATTNISARPRTVASVTWSPPVWNTVGEAAAAQRTPELAGVLQEVVSRPGWSASNAVGFIITGTGHRTADSFDKAGGAPPRLTVIYDLPDLPVTVTNAVASSADDAEESAAGAMSLTSSDLELVNDAATGAGDQKVGVRFAGVNIPPGWTISNAVIQFTADETQSETTSLTIRAQATDNAPPFSATNLDISTRPVTASSVSWQPPAWNTLSEAGPAQQTPNLASALQEIVNRPGWMEGNAVAFLITGTGHRTADSFDKAGGTPARLIVTFQRAAPAPAVIGIERAGGGALALTWPASHVVFTLYSATNLDAPAWTHATNEPVLSNGVWLVPLSSVTNGQRFYRLQSP